MQIREFMSTGANMCIPESSCARAGELMRRHQRGFLSIVDSLKTRRVVGMVTERDIMLHLVHLDLPASEVAVKTCMSGPPTMISAEADLGVAVGVMKKEALCRLPVIEDGRLVGVLSLEDIALAARRQWAYVGAHVNEQHVTEILEAIAIAGARLKKRTRRRAPVKARQEKTA
jgi:CBS domain-containing protein